MSSPATLHPCEKCTSLDVSEKVILAVRAAASAVLAYNLDLPIESICSSQCWLPPYVRPDKYAHATNEDRKRAQFFLAGMIAEQKLRGPSGDTQNRP